VLVFLATVTRQKKEIRDTNRKEKVKLFPFSYDMILYLKVSKDTTTKKKKQQTKKTDSSI
jgi:hypothetical protein